MNTPPRNRRVEVAVEGRLTTEDKEKLIQNLDIEGSFDVYYHSILCPTRITILELGNKQFADFASLFGYTCIFMSLLTLPIVIGSRGNKQHLVLPMATILLLSYRSFVFSDYDNW
jgi:hypothetical protein